jgi:hypothetical protein
MRGRRPDPAVLGNSGYERIPNDAYYTERWVTEALLSQVRFRGALWEPAAGRGDISAVLRGAGYNNVIESDIVWPDPVDFLRQRSLPDYVESIVTNPPYDQIADFIGHALILTRQVEGMVAMLARHEFDCAKGRKGFFDRPPFAMRVVLMGRPRWVPKKPGDKSPRYPYSWFVWDWRHSGSATLRYAP